MRISIILLCVLLLVGCGGAVEPIALDEQIITFFKASDYDAVLALCSEDVKKEISKGTTYFTESLEGIGPLESVTYENNVLTFVGTKQVKADLVFVGDVITEFTFQNEVVKYDSAILETQILTQAASDYKTLLADQGFGHTQENLDGKSLEGGRLAQYLKSMVAICSLEADVTYEVNMDAFSVTVLNSAGVNVINLQYDERATLNEIGFPRLEKMKASGMAFVDSKHTKSDYYDGNYLKESFREEYPSIEDAYDLTHEFVKSYNESNEMFYGLLADDLKSVLSYENFNDYIGLMIKSTGISFVDYDYMSTNLPLDYNDLFYVTTLSARASDLKQHLSYQLEYEFDVAYDRASENTNKIQNVYIQSYPTFDTLEAEPVYKSEKPELRLANGEALITALKAGDMNALDTIVINNLSLEEKTQLYEFQKSVVDTFEGVYHRQVSIVRKDNSARKLVEYVLLSDTDQYSRLIIDFDGDENIIAYNVARIFTEIQ